MKNCVKSFGKNLWEENVLKKAERAKRRKNGIHKRLRLCNKIINREGIWRASMSVKEACNDEKNACAATSYIVYSGGECLKKDYKKFAQRKVRRHIENDAYVRKSNIYKKQYDLWGEIYH